MSVPEKDCGIRCRSLQHARQLNIAVSRGSLRQIQLFLSTCHNPITGCDDYGRTVLHVAASYGKHEVVQWLLSCDNIDISAQDKESAWTALHRSVFYGQLNVTRLLISTGAKIHTRDRDGLSALDLAMKDKLRHVTIEKSDPQEVFSWGENYNFTLGHDSQQAKKLPERVDFFFKNGISIKQAELCKYHSVYLSVNGQVFTCGLGRGGRLGTGHERTCLMPTKMDGLNGEVCSAISAARDHTILIMESGQIYSCGLNKYHTLGQLPAPKLSLIPKPMSMKWLKGAEIRGALASKFHTIIYTDRAIYTFGLNAGQLGQQKVPGEHLVSQPRPVSAFSNTEFEVKHVAASDGATVVLTSRGDIYVLHEYQCRKIASKMLDAVQVAVTGGHLDAESFPDKTTTEVVKQELMVAVLSSTGQVWLWRGSTTALRPCSWSIKRELQVTQICLRPSCLALVTREGEAFTVNIGAHTKQHSSGSPREPAVSSSRGVTGEAIALVVERVPMAYRTTAMTVDNRASNYIVLQSIPQACVTDIPQCRASEIVQKFVTLLQDASLSDSIHDCILKVHNEKFPAHKYVLAYRSDFFRKLFCEQSPDSLEMENGKPVVTLKNIDAGLLTQLLTFLYTDSCELLTLGHSVKNGTRPPIDTADPHQNVTPIKTGMTAYAVAQDLKKRKEKVSENETKKSSKDAGALGDLKEMARRFGVKSLLTRLQCVEIKEGLIAVARGRHVAQPALKLDRNKLRNLTDVSICCDDGVVLQCHKCVLVSRLEYFHSMLCSGWIEASSTEPLSLPVPSDVLTVVLHFIYTDELVADISGVDLVCNVLAVADQLLVPRLKDLCEVHLTSLVSLRNVAELLELASVYSADQLKASCQQFITINLPALLEARGLDVLSDDVMDQLAEYYRNTVPGLDCRRLTPWEGWPDVACLENLENQYPPDEETPAAPDKRAGDGRRSKQRKRKVRKPSASEDLSEVKCPVSEEPHCLSRTPETSTPLPPEAPPPTPPIQSPEVEHVQPETKPSSVVEKGLTSSTSMVRGLKEIMEEERSSLSKQQTAALTSVSSKKAVKLSQRERKRLTSQRLSESDFHEADTSPLPSCPWGNMSTVVHSFKDLVLDEEMHQPAQRKIITARPTPTTPTVPSPKSLADSLPQWGGIKTPTNKVKSPVKSISFAEILEAEKQEKETLQRATNKPLSIIQREEEAIQELLLAYRAHDNWDEQITVERVPLPQASPTWQAIQKHH